LLLQVVLCQNHIPDQEWMDRTMAHELVHAFDHCRNKIDWNKCEHHACSEVRYCHEEREAGCARTDFNRV
jgi:hypothetical protein